MRNILEQAQSDPRALQGTSHCRVKLRALVRLDVNEKLIMPVLGLATLYLSSDIFSLQNT